MKVQLDPFAALLESLENFEFIHLDPVRRSLRPKSKGATRGPHLVCLKFYSIVTLCQLEKGGRDIFSELCCQ
jgi:hypothetical protein